MPELPEVEAVCRKVRREAAGQTIVDARVERANVVAPDSPEVVARSLRGRAIAGVERRGKNIFLKLDNGWALHVHLRMTGNLYVIPDVRLRLATARAWFELEGGRALIFDDPRNLGRMRLYPAEELSQVFADAGVEPLSREFTADWLAAAVRSSKKPAKLFLMDQQPLAGLGNIYAAEALFRARIDPRKPIGKLRRPKLEALHGAIVDVLREGVESAVRAYSQPGIFQEAESFPCAVYGREGEPCEACGRAIRRIAQGGRSTYFCPRCQK